MTSSNYARLQYSFLDVILPFLILCPEHFSYDQSIELKVRENDVALTTHTLSEWSQQNFNDVTLCRAKDSRREVFTYIMYVRCEILFVWYLKLDGGETGGIGTDWYFELFWRFYNIIYVRTLDSMRINCLKHYASFAPNAYTFLLVPVKLRELWLQARYEGLH